MMLLMPFIMMVQSSDLANKNCDDPQTQHQMNACAYQGYQAADKRLNAQWKITHDHMKGLDKNRIEDGRISYVKALLNAQRNWIAYRDSHCLSVSFEYRGGTAEPLSRYTCLNDETNKRVEALKGLILKV